MNPAAIPITILTGFLGSGKTTLLRRWRHQADLRDAAIIVHDLSEFGLDAELLTDEGTPTEVGELCGRTAALHGEHARGKLHESLTRVLGQVAALDPPSPHVLLESTGAARPWPLITAATADPRFQLRHFIVTVDALNLHRDFADGRVLSGEAPAPGDPALNHAAVVLAEQLAFASIIILTKTDTVSKATLEVQTRAMRKIQPRAAIGQSTQAGLLLSQLERIPAPNIPTFETTANHLGLDAMSAATADDVDCLILRDPRPFHPVRLHDACRNHLGTGLYRTKGFLWLASRPGHVLLWQQSGSQIALELTGQWRAEIMHNHDGRLLPEEVAHLREQLATAHPVFGDRHNELTLIGLPAAREAFAAALRAALCTDAEITAWQCGESFSDPWPTSLRQVR